MAGAALRIAMVAGEPSGDLLGGRVIRALRAKLDRPLTVEGIGGPAMQAEGLSSLYPLERLSVMGLVEPLARLPELLRLRRQLLRRFTDQPPHLFLGIDAQDFNLGLERRLRRRGVRTAQLVSPTVWAWRPGRVHRVAEAVDSVLCLFPFEPPLYEGLDVQAHFVGHPMLADLGSQPTRSQAREALGIEAGARVIALLPGSRQGEVARLGPSLLLAGRLLQSRDAARQLLMPAASDERLVQCRQLIEELHMQDAVRLLSGQSRLAMLAADVVLLASGTASLEAMLLARPMVIGYRVAPASWALLSRLAVTEFVGLPNIIAGRPVVPELLQDRLTPAALALEAEVLLFNGEAQLRELAGVRDSLDRDFESAVASALIPLLHRD